MCCGVCGGGGGGREGYNTLKLHAIHVCSWKTVDIFPAKLESATSHHLCTYTHKIHVRQNFQDLLASKE